ncbi:SigE family RNA polymerase sigma factor [Streptomyces sp. NPDC059881]|uniref:SigE family RNA polymerase sigma factor n=1 Tax=Streptomyces sp. NPDC059881 TaxID=3346986 RepID=UPI003651D9DE
MRRARADEFRDFAAGRTGHLYRSACLLTAGDTHLAEDLVQETLGRVYAMWGRIARIDNPAGHAQTLLVRTYLGHRRLHPAGERPPEHMPDTPSGRSDDPARRIALLGALAELAPKDRAVVVLRYWEDRSVDETADAMNVSSATVRTRSTRSLAQLRERLGGSLCELTATL